MRLAGWEPASREQVHALPATAMRVLIPSCSKAMGLGGLGTGDKAVSLSLQPPSLEEAGGFSGAMAHVGMSCARAVCPRKLD